MVLHNSPNYNGHPFLHRGLLHNTHVDYANQEAIT